MKIKSHNKLVKFAQQVGLGRVNCTRSLQKRYDYGVTFVFRLFIAAIILINFTGCAWQNHPIPSGLNKEIVNEGNSLVVFSTWVEKPASVGQVTSLHIASSETNEFVSYSPIDNYHVHSHFQRGFGFLNAVQLAPGEYYLVITTPNMYTEYEKSKKPIKFTVEGDSINYLGEIYLYHTESAGVLEVRKNDERDLNLFIKHNPQYKRSDFKYLHTNKS